MNEFAKSKPLKWFEENLINYVPLQCRGARKQTSFGVWSLACQGVVTRQALVSGLAFPGRSVKALGRCQGYPPG